MKKLDLYIIKHFFYKLFFLIIGFIILFTLVSIIEHLDKFIDASMPAKDIFIYHIYSMPWFISIGLPMSILISTVFSFNSMQKNHELTALKASGIGLLRISIPLFIIGIILSIASFEFENNIVTHYLQKKISLEQKYNLKRSSKKDTKKNDIYRQIGPNTMLTIKKFKYLPNIAQNVSIQYFNENKIVKRFDTPKLKWYPKKELWLAREYSERIFIEDSIKYKKSTDTLININITPFDLAQETLKPEEMNYWELDRFVKKMYENGLYERRWVVDLYFKSAFACTNFLMILFGICLSIRKPRTSMAVGLTFSIGIIFLYYTFLKVGQSLGYNGILNPFASVWSINIFFFIIGFYLFSKTRT